MAFKMKGPALYRKSDTKTSMYMKWSDGTGTSNLKSPFPKKDCSCWEGYERVPGTKPCAKGSCKKK
jgi:hypothetical protein